MVFSTPRKMLKKTMTLMNRVMLRLAEPATECDLFYWSKKIVVRCPRHHCIVLHRRHVLQTWRFKSLNITLCLLTNFRARSNIAFARRCFFRSLLTSPMNPNCQKNWSFVPSLMFGLKWNEGNDRWSMLSSIMLRLLPSVIVRGSWSDRKCQCSLRMMSV